MGSGLVKEAIVERKRRNSNDKEEKTHLSSYFPDGIGSLTVPFGGHGTQGLCRRRNSYCSCRARVPESYRHGSTSVRYNYDEYCKCGHRYNDHDTRW